MLNMATTILLFLLGFILVLLVVLTYHFRSLEKKHKASHAEMEQPVHELMEQQISYTQGWTYACIVLLIITAIALLYLLVKGSLYEGHVMEWMNIIVRWMHITFGIAWIGASFYFVFLENALNRTDNVRDELAGNLWAVHGGGFYYLEKYKTAPKTIPKDLHWFKYEAYFTWLSGFGLLFVVYYFNAKAFLIDTNVLKITPVVAICVGIGSFIVAWIVYDIMCKTALVKKPLLFAVAGTLVATAFAYFYAHVFSARAAYIHFGAMLGTLMVANVFFVIIPAQKKMVRSAKLGILPDPAPGKKALARSLHNNYLTLPVLFVMISNHFPSTFGNKYSWLILLIISLGAAGVKHWLNLREKGRLNVWVLPVSILILLAAAFISAPAKQGECREQITNDEMFAVVQRRCTQCHSSKPTDDVFTSAPNGVMYNTPEDVLKLKDKIMQRVVLSQSMPQGNKTNMTQEERDLMRCWIEQATARENVKNNNNQ
jgi:uncharacterized membrane protein